MAGVVVESVLSDGPAAVLVKRLAGVGVDVEAREVAARNIEPQAVATLEDQRGWIHLDRERVNLIRLEHRGLRQRVSVSRPDNTIRDVQVNPNGKIGVRGINIDKFGREVCIWSA